MPVEPQELASAAPASTSGGWGLDISSVLVGLSAVQFVLALYLLRLAAVRLSRARLRRALTLHLGESLPNTREEMEEATVTMEQPELGTVAGPRRSGGAS